MKKYNVALEFLYHTSVEVEAESAEDAMEKVYKMTNEEVVASDTVPSSVLEEGIITNVYDENWKDLGY